MTAVDKIAPFVRIFLYAITGVFAGEWLDAATVELIRNDPALLMVISGGIAAGWYALAKWRGWST